MIEIRGLSKSFNGTKVLDDVNIAIKSGQTKVVIGRSGVGKSVLLKCIMGLVKPDKGSIRVNGVELVGLPDREYNKIRMEMGMVFQNGALFDSMTVAENVAFVVNEFMKLDAKTVQARVIDALSLVGLKDIGHVMPADLSGGMRKRVSLARVLCMEPQLILYDEPTSGLDPVTADSLKDLMKELHDRLKVTSVAVTHDMNLAYQVADSIAMIYQGKIIAQGVPEEIKGSKNPVVQQFINGKAHGPITDDEYLKTKVQYHL